MEFLEGFTIKSGVEMRYFSRIIKGKTFQILEGQNGNVMKCGSRQEVIDFFDFIRYSSEALARHNGTARALFVITNNDTGEALEIWLDGKTILETVFRPKAIQIT